MTIAVAACGGGGGGGSGPTPLSISGVAASGAPVANGAGYALDAATGKTIPFSTDANGKFTAVLTGYSGPFVLHVMGNNLIGAPVNMYSLATTSNSGGTVNITPLSDLVLGYAAGVNTQVLEASCTANLSVCPAKLNAIYNGLTAANTSITAAMPAALALPNGFNAFTTAFNADHTGVDAVLDKIVVKAAAASGAGAYTVTVLGTANPVLTAPTTGIVASQSTTAPTTGTLTTAEAAQAANLAAVQGEIQAFFASLNAAANSADYAAMQTALTPLLDASFLLNGEGKTAFLTATAAGTRIQLGTAITGGAVAPTAGGAFTAGSPGPNVSYDAGNCVTSVWVHLSANAVPKGAQKLLNVGYNPTTCLGGTWTGAGNQRTFDSTIYPQNFSFPAMGANAAFTKPTLALEIQNQQAAAYTSVVISGPGLVTQGAQTALSPVTLLPSALTLNLRNAINDPYYGGNSTNVYNGGREGSANLVSCAWVGSNPNGWGPFSGLTPCFNGDAVAGSEYTVQFYNGTTLVETHIDRLEVTPTLTLPASWYPAITSVTPPGSSLTTSGGSVTVNWTLPAGASSEMVFLNFNDVNWNTVNNTWAFVGGSALSKTLAVGPMFNGAPAPARLSSAAFVMTRINNISTVGVSLF